MTNSSETSNDYDEEGPRQSLALPPLYVVSTNIRCPKCCEGLRVHTLGCAAYHDGEDSRPIYDFHFLNQIRTIPSDVVALLNPWCPGYFFDREATGDRRRYLMNHCPCGARLDDDFLHGDIGAAFWPGTPSGYQRLRLLRLPIDEPIPIESNYMIGGGDYLDTEDAQSLWAAQG